MPRDITRQSPLGGLADRTFIDEADDPAMPPWRAPAGGVSPKSVARAFGVDRQRRPRAATSRARISSPGDTTSPCQAALPCSRFALGALIGVTHAERNGHQRRRLWRHACRRGGVGVSQRIPISTCATAKKCASRSTMAILITGIVYKNRVFATSVHPDWSTMQSGAANNKESAGASSMTTKRLGLIMNGVTGRMGLESASDPLDRRDPRPGRRCFPIVTASCPIRSWSAGDSRCAGKAVRDIARTTDLDKALADKNDTKLSTARPRCGRRC